MPFRVRKNGDKWVVQKVKRGGGIQQVGSHDSRAAADRQLTALRIKEGQENA